MWKKEHEPKNLFGWYGFDRDEVFTSQAANVVSAAKMSSRFPACRIVQWKNGTFDVVDYGGVTVIKSASLSTMMNKVLELLGEWEEALERV